MIKQETLSLLSSDFLSKIREMEWLSGRIPKGGVFNPPKVNYSPETKQFLKCKFYIRNKKKQNT